MLALVETFGWNIRKPTFNKIETTLAGAGGGAGAGYRKKHLLLKQFISWIEYFHLPECWVCPLAHLFILSKLQIHKYKDTQIQIYKYCSQLELYCFSRSFPFLCLLLLCLGAKYPFSWEAYIHSLHCNGNDDYDDVVNCDCVLGVQRYVSILDCIVGRERFLEVQNCAIEIVTTQSFILQKFIK